MNSKSGTGSEGDVIFKPSPESFLPIIGPAHWTKPRLDDFMTHTTKAHAERGIEDAKAAQDDGENATRDAVIDTVKSAIRKFEERDAG